MFRDQIIAKAYPNAHEIHLVKRTWTTLREENEGPAFYVFTADDEWDFDEEEDARAKFDELVKVLRETPNWEAQAEYDAQWGEAYYPQRSEDY